MSNSQSSQSNAKGRAIDPLESALIEAYRLELRERYTGENAHRFRELRDLRPESIHELRDFFLAYIYPAAEGRGARDSSFDAMGEVLKSPRKLLPLFGTAVSSIFKLGGRIGQAMQAGLRTLEAYIESKGLEKAMLGEARAKHVTPEDLSHRARVYELIRAMPRKKILRFQKDVLRLFESLANTKLLESTLEIMNDSCKVMADRPQTYTQRELAGLGYGLELLGGGYRLFQEMSADEIRLVLKGIELIELDWYERVCAGTVIVP